jgi:hypothetical protein
MPKVPDAYRLLQQAKQLPLADLEQMIESLVAEVDDRKLAAQDKPSDREQDHWRQEYRKCGKLNCRCATSAYRHGPYWYRTVWQNGTAKKEYRKTSRKS